MPGAEVADARAQVDERGRHVRVIVPWKSEAKRIAALLGESAPELVGDASALPDAGVVMIPLKLAKGLEFDRVIIPDASARLFPENELSRNRLYTTISRATRQVTVMSRGPMSGLWRKARRASRVFACSVGGAGRAQVSPAGLRGGRAGSPALRGSLAPVARLAVYRRAAPSRTGCTSCMVRAPCSIRSSQEPVNSCLFFSAMSSTAVHSGRWNLRVLTFIT